MSHLMTSLLPMHASVAMAAEAKAKENKVLAWHTGLPDSDITVLCRREDDEQPIATGYHDGMFWRFDYGQAMQMNVVGWMHLDEAVKLLDGGAR